MSFPLLLPHLPPTLFPFKTPTPVQDAVLPLLKTKDVIVEAATGSGKTIAYILPILNALVTNQTHTKKRTEKQVAAIVIVPTRELGVQVYGVLTGILERAQSQWNHISTKQNEVDGADNTMSKQHMNALKILATETTHKLLIGGQTAKTKTQAQKEKRRRRQTKQDTTDQDVIARRNSDSEDERIEIDHVHNIHANIIIATPGRLAHLLSNDVLDAKKLDILILDEADRLLDMGFGPTLEIILNKLPKQRRTGLFSATMTDGLETVVKASLRNPYKVVVKVANQQTRNAQRIPSALSIDYVELRASEKLAYLINTLKAAPVKSIVFFATCNQVIYFYKLLMNLFDDLDLMSIHGKINMANRTKIYASFVEADYGILLCTDIAARGLDIPDVDLVVHFDAPQDPQAFVHRSGRTGRSGRKGRALLFVQPNEDAYITYLARKSVPLTKLDVSEAEKAHPDTVFIEALKTDRDLYDRSVLAFVSYLRSYSKHELSYIFRVEQLELEELVKGYLLLRAPKCPELKDKNITGIASPEYVEQMDQLLKYVDPVQEAARLHALSIAKPDLPPKKRKMEEVGSWSKVKTKAAAKEKRAEKAALMRIAEMEKKLAEEASNVEEDNDWAEMVKEKKAEKSAGKGDFADL